MCTPFCQYFKNTISPRQWRQQQERIVTFSPDISAKRHYKYVSISRFKLPTWPINNANLSNIKILFIPYSTPGDCSAHNGIHLFHSHRVTWAKILHIIYNAFTAVQCLVHVLGKKFQVDASSSLIPHLWFCHLSTSLRLLCDSFFFCKLPLRSTWVRTWKMQAQGISLRAKEQNFYKP